MFRFKSVVIDCFVLAFVALRLQYVKCKKQTLKSIVHELTWIKKNNHLSLSSNAKMLATRFSDKTRWIINGIQSRTWMKANHTRIETTKKLNSKKKEKKKKNTKCTYLFTLPQLAKDKYNRRGTVAFTLACVYNW